MDGLTLRYAQQNAGMERIELTDIEFNILGTLMKNPKQIFQLNNCMKKHGMSRIIIRQIIQSWFIFVILEENREGSRQSSIH